MASLVFVYLFVAISQNAFGVLCGPTASPKSRVSGSRRPDDRTLKAAEMLSYMDVTKDPCTDFFSFACGKFPKVHPATITGSLTTGVFEMIEDAFQLRLHNMLKAASKPADSAIDKKVKSVYESCITFSNQVTKSSYRQKLLALIDEFGGMPAVKGNAWKEANFDWLATVGKILKKYGKPIILEVSILPDVKDSTVNQIYISYPDLESKSTYLDAERADDLAYHQQVIENNLEQYIGLTKKLSKQVAKELVSFEVALAPGMVSEHTDKSIGELSQSTTATAMTQKYASMLNIVQLIQIVFGRTINTPIYDFVDSYQRNLVEVLKKTPKRTIANYIMYQLMRDFMIDVPFNSADNAQSHREEVCFAETKKLFGQYLENKVYRSYNSEAIQQDLNSIWQNIKQSFGAELNSNKLEWMALRTRQKAVEKLNAINMEINTFQRNDFGAEYRDLIVHRTDFIENIKSILQLHSRHYLATLNDRAKPYDRKVDVLSYSPAIVRNENTVRVPVAMLLDPKSLWGLNYPNALKYSTIGWLLAHELVHGFDDFGRKFDQHGNHNLWWDPNSSREFEARRSCFADQYNQYLYGGRKLPKRTVQAENIADNGGLRLAYDAYIQWLQLSAGKKAILDRETLPTMRYTNKQLFFIGSAQMWCNDVHPLMMDSIISADEHAPNKFRVIGSFSNFPEFAKEFQCGASKPMNRGNKRCEIF